MSAVASYCSAVVVLQLVSASAVSAVIIDLNVAVFQQRLSLTLQEVSPLLGLAAQLMADHHWE
ncbi:hypothetical protein LC608_34280 [Nostoc sp. XA010]|uniref:hypothetical protein n=1 Tax=Nostoc sp. XA010 TaxID=2780407 RepID=UPI001E59DB47|nr:hypothetical protein [Nostoc sp. XA010]MCC5661920.1 hypothetical protein [Nostoc sp. XA010]